MHGAPGPARFDDGLVSAAVTLPVATSEPFGQTLFHLPLLPLALICATVHLGNIAAFGALTPYVVVLMFTSGAPTFPWVVLLMPSVSDSATAAGLALLPMPPATAKLPL